MSFDSEPSIGMPRPVIVFMTLTFEPMSQFLARVQGIFVQVLIQIPSVVHEPG